MNKSIAKSDSYSQQILKDEPNFLSNNTNDIDKYLEQLEESFESKSLSLQRSDSNILPSTSNSNQNWSMSKKIFKKSFSLNENLQFNKDCFHKSDLDEIFLASLFEKSNSTNLKLVWRNLSCYTNSSNRKCILDNQNGEICSGQLTAIIGPSGAGKSTLLECLSGRKKKKIKGEIFISYNRAFIKSQKKVKISFIGQRDQLIETLTVKETLKFATKLKNYQKAEKKYFHSRIVQSVLRALNLEKCSDVRVSKISGGQFKRLTLAVELISGPDIIMLDEPTSGLDASSTYQCITLLRKLTDLQNIENFYKPPAIACSIHQPSARVLNIFHQIMVISFDGRCLFQGSPQTLLSHLSKFNLNCPQFHNPADYIIEIASGDYGPEPIDKLATFEAKKQLQILSEEKIYLVCHKLMINSQELNEIRVKVSKVLNDMKKESFPVFQHFRLLLVRTYLTTIRDQKLLWFRFFQAIFIALLMGFLYDYPIGQPDGCALSLVNNTTRTGFHHESTQDNIAFIFFITLFTVMACMMPTVLTFPAELSVQIQERNNGWYSCWTYYWSKIISDLPVQTLITILFSIIIYLMTGQIWSFKRFGFFVLISILISNIAQCVGLFFGTIYVRSAQTAIFMAPLSMAPVFLLSGFFGKISKVPIFLKPIAVISYVRYAFEAFLVIIYGLDRCPTVFTKNDELLNFDSIQKLNANQPNAINNHTTSSQIRSQYFDTSTPLYTTLPKVWSGFYNPMDYLAYRSVANLTKNSTGSLVLRYYELEDDHLWHNIAILCGILIVIRFAAYFILIYKTNEKK